VAKPGSSVVTSDGPIRKEQVHPGSVMLKDDAHSPQAEPVRTRIPDGLKFSPFSSRRNIPSYVKSEGGGNIRVKKIPSVSAVGLPAAGEHVSRPNNLLVGSTEGCSTQLSSSNKYCSWPCPLWPRRLKNPVQGHAQDPKLS
jgi:hypothetical protein